jgi:hypothetical protein
MAAISALNCNFLAGAKVARKAAVRARTAAAAPVQAKARDVFAPLRCAFILGRDEREMRGL